VLIGKQKQSYNYVVAAASLARYGNRKHREKNLRNDMVIVQRRIYYL
jgi:hypothetical protein